jgi:histidinol phosphatase-like PHP family hydrolase
MVAELFMVQFLESKKEVNLNLLYHEKTYDLSELARYNLHIHTTFSSCAKPEMELCRILQYAEKSNIKTIAITDHFNSRNFNILANNNELKRQASSCHTNVKVLYGAELSAYGVNKYLDSLEINQELDYRLYSYNHYHLDFWEHPLDRTPRGYVNHGIEVLKHLIISGRADCIAHPFIGRFIKISDDKTLVTKEMKDKELGDILDLGRNHNVAWEINLGAVLGDPNFAKRYWNVGKEIGVVFHFGTDSHNLASIDTDKAVEQIRPLLN